ncbi:MAG TPA: DUF2332 domain-containing protein [Acidimicrobiales bacterium]
MPEPPLPVQFRAFGASAARDGCSTYGTICAEVAEDEEILALLADTPPSQRRPNLLLAAVHYLLLNGAQHPLAAFYDTINDGPTAEPDGALYPAFRDFCLTHREAVIELAATRSTQTNEVGRCSILLPALCAISAQHDEAISLLDLGTSAGLNLLFDLYGYTYRQADDGTTVLAGDPASPVQLECAVRGPMDRLPRLEMPDISYRAGLDLSPISADSLDEARWLLACLWPDNLDRFTRLRKALELWNATPLAPPLMQGDMIDDLDWVANALDNGGPLVVFHSWAVAYLNEDRQRALVEAVQALGRTRPVHHLYAELPFETPGLPMPDPPEEITHSNAATALVHIGPGEEPARWANVHPHGRWIRWWGPR